ncbi:unnamed protein product [Thlaspi arvense]|uniref:Uncharacterized protein n=1 Tax=Thlaspi arvense TaxID=13288 RepID=A0AAU9RKF8_THLAR|nr:unnamed protein product [Thlaspi arvense]
MRSALQIASSFGYFRPNHLVSSRRLAAAVCRPPSPWRSPPQTRLALTPAATRVRAFSTGEADIESAEVEKVSKKPSVCTADELHYVSVSNSDWRLALWRYLPPPQAPPRNHPLLLLSGVGTNAIGYDLSPGALYCLSMLFDMLSFRICSILSALGCVFCLNLLRQGRLKRKLAAGKGNMADWRWTGLEIWAVKRKNSRKGKHHRFGGCPELRQSQLENFPLEGGGSISQGFDTWILEVRGAGLSTQASDSKAIEQSAHAISDQLEATAENVTDGVLCADQQSTIISSKSAESDISSIERELTGISTSWDESEVSVFFTTIEDFQKQLDLIVKYDWDFDHYLEEDIPAAVR